MNCGALSAFPKRSEHIRLSCGIGFRHRNHKIKTPWPLPESAQRFIAALPEHLKHYTEGCTGIDPHWKG